MTVFTRRYLRALAVSVCIAFLTVIVHAEQTCYGSDNIYQSLPIADNCISFDLGLVTTAWDEGGGYGNLTVHLNTISGCNASINRYNIEINAYDTQTLELIGSYSAYNQTDNESGGDWQWTTSTAAQNVFVSYSIWGSTMEDHDFSLGSSLGILSCS